MREPILLPEEIEALLQETPKSRRSAFRSRELFSNSLPDVPDVLSRSGHGPEFRRFRKDLRQSGFSWIKTLSEFRHDLTPSVDPGILEDLFDLSFLDRRENILLSGPSNSGKTHLAIALGEKASGLGLAVSFRSFSSLLDELKKRGENGEFSDDIVKARNARILILDDFGGVRISREDSSNFLDFLSQRSSKGGLVLTSRISLIGWNKVFGSGSFSEKILEHLLEHVSWIRLHPSNFSKNGHSWNP